MNLESLMFGWFKNVVIKTTEPGKKAIVARQKSSNQTSHDSIQ